MSLFGGKADNERALTSDEIRLIRQVFENAPLPSLNIVSIGDGVNGRGGPWTDSDYQINVGKNYEMDLSRNDPSTLVHEMVHVWQYYNKTLTKAHAFGAQMLFIAATDYLYSYDLGDSWDDFGFEGQAQMVEDWYTNDHMRTVGSRYVYIEKVLRTGSEPARSMTLQELQNWPPKVYLIDTTRPDPPGPAPHLTHPFDDLLEKRFQPGDPAALARVEKLKEICLKMARPKELLARLRARRPGDKTARLFYEALHPATTARLLKILEDRH